MIEILGLFASIALVAFTAIAGWMLTERCKQRQVAALKGVEW